ncbi:GDSL lipase-like isoform X3 [Pistacia vera]|uniref:GDSL lipase-like isoform X3 n=1 Tax=Pistacia vera TaxID=55513 RepID=UPI001263E424|nr:GDSL lipase-like isoform X3 [Pistacia vera]
MTSLSFIYGVSLVVFAAIFATTTSLQSRRHAALFVFGDSLYDPGNNNFINSSITHKANYPPYGETFFRFPTGRFSDGRLIPDFIAKYAHLPYWKPYLAPGQHEFINGANFASGGASAIADNDPTAEIYALGGRKFAFQNVAPLGCTPLLKQLKNLTKTECWKDTQALARQHNQALVTAAKELEIQLPGFNFIIFDYFTTLMNLQFNPLKYGFKEADIACCGSGTYHASDCGIGDYELCRNPNEYVYFDGAHLTDKANSRLAELFWEGGMNVTAPVNMKQLLELELQPSEIKKFREEDDDGGATNDE